MKSLFQLITIVNYTLPALFFNSCSISEIEVFDYHNKILFTSNRSGKEQLYIMNPDGTNIKQITKGQYWHKNGRWSPDAQKIICNTEEQTTTAGFQMIIMDTDRSNRMLFGYGTDMCWAPNKNQIVFSYNPRSELGDRTTNIYVKNYKNKEYAQLTNDLGASIVVLAFHLMVQ